MAEKKEKMIMKNIRCNYFKPILHADKRILARLQNEIKKIETLQQKEESKLTEKQKEDINKKDEIVKLYKALKKYNPSVWDMKSILEFLLARNFKSTVINNIEIEPDSLTPLEDDIISLQLSKIRDNTLPSKKKFGELRQDIILEDDEYIGEFVSIMYDCRLNILMIQSNIYGASTSQIEKYFTILRRKYLKEAKIDSINELELELRVIIDKNKINNIEEAEVFKKIRIKGSDIMLDSFIEDKESMLGKIRRFLGKNTGIDFDITLSMQQNSRKKENERTFKTNEVKQLIKDFKTIDNDLLKPIIEITERNDEESNTEVVNLLKPRLTDIVSFKFPVKKAIDHKFLYEKMKLVYNKRRNMIENMISPK